MIAGKVYPPFSTDKVIIAVSKEVIQAGMPILGRYLKVGFKRLEDNCIALLRVVRISTQNRKIPNPDMMLSMTGETFVERDVVKSDVTLAECEVLTAFAKTPKGYKRVPLDTIIGSFTPAEFINNNEINEIIGRKSEEVFYLGKAVGEEFDVPFIFRPFYKLNESYHILIAGQTGSGKSTEARKILIGYLMGDKIAKEEHELIGKPYRQMSFLILDPVGEFSQAFAGKDLNKFGLDRYIPDIWKQAGRNDDIEILSIKNIVMDDWETLREVMMSKKRLLVSIGIKHHDNRKYATDELINFLKDKTNNDISKLADIEAQELLDFIRQNITKIYTSKEKQADVLDIIASDMTSDFEITWLNIKRLFIKSKSKKTITEIVENLTNPKTIAKKTVILNLSDLGWEDPFKYMVIAKIFSTLKEKGNQAYTIGNDILNTLVVIDEAHRLVPPTVWASDETLESYMKIAKREIVTAFRETRKFGIGWLLISTRIANLDKEIWEHTRVRLFGFGLSTGKDAELIKEQYGRDILQVYKEKITDPYDLMGSDAYSFMLDGPVNLLSRRVPEFYAAYNNVEEFLQKNNLAGLKTPKSIEEVGDELKELLGE